MLIRDPARRAEESRRYPVAERRAHEVHHSRPAADRHRLRSTCTHLLLNAMHSDMRSFDRNSARRLSYFYYLRPESNCTWLNLWLAWANSS